MCHHIITDPPCLPNSMSITGPDECSNIVGWVAAKENKVKGSAPFIASSKQVNSHIIITLSNLVMVRSHPQNLLSIMKQREDKVKELVVQLYLTLWNRMDCSLSGPSLQRIFQARILEWVAFPFSRGSSGPTDQTWVSPGRQILYHLRHQGSTSTEFVQYDETERKKEAYK